MTEFDRKKEVAERVIAEIQEALSMLNLNEPLLKDVVDVDTENQTITVKFDYQVVPEDNYIGLACY